ncbi:MAG TPA: Crp/Fnr family transcriptional regulator [Patescibacteria group bacterium]|nr:Crp/Fnr family transcriptional regulator [Patescibacteria group bacterium]
MDNKLWYLQQLSLFKNIPKDKLEQVENVFFMKHYAKKEIIFEPGDHDKVFIVKTGEVKLYRLNASGKKVIIERLLPGSFFGDLGTNGPIDLFVEATSNSYVCSLNRDKFFSLVSQYPDLSEKLMKQLFERLMHVEKRMSSIASDTVLQRFVQLLLSFGKEKNQAFIEVPERLTHEEIAQMLGTSRQTITTLMNDLEKKGVIRRVKKALHLNSEKLQEYI